MKHRKMNQSTLFRHLGAPLKNMRWSWGAVRKDGAVFLRVWRDDIKSHDGSKYVRLAWIDNDETWPGYIERREHIELIRNGYRSYLTICTAEDVDTIPRRIGSFDCKTVISGGRLAEFDDCVWIEMGPGVPVTEARRQGKPKKP
jgi:hypothetical protein